MLLGDRLCVSRKGWTGRWWVHPNGHNIVKTAWLVCRAWLYKSALADSEWWDFIGGDSTSPWLFAPTILWFHPSLKDFLSEALTRGLLLFTNGLECNLLALWGPLFLAKKLFSSVWRFCTGWLHGHMPEVLSIKIQWNWEMGPWRAWMWPPKNMFVS